MRKTTFHWRSGLTGGLQTSYNQLLNKAAARVELLMLLNGLVSLFPVIQHQATTEALDLVIHASVIETSTGKTPLGDGDPGGESRVRRHPVEFTRVVILHFLLVVICPI